jgi:transposase
MSQNNPPILYAGLDVAKATLQFHLRGVGYRLHNTKKDHTRILRLLAEAEAAAPPGTRIQVILEATGGYEAALVAALHAAPRPVSVIQPSRARHFARARAEHAKTDPIDAEVLTAFGEALRPAPTPAPSAAQSHLAVLVGRRAQLVETRVVELNRAEHYTDKLLRQQSRQHLALLDRQIAACERAIAAQLAADAAMKARAVRVQQVPGIGPTVAAILQAQPSGAR